ncbi:MAG: Ig domain-containing protein [Clostridia bacterium]|nr:Ig domain-containing protein [Clostridia bacterium]
MALLAVMLPLYTPAAPEKYGLKIAGVEITSDNWKSLPYGSTFQYMPTTHTLVIKGDLTLTDSSIGTLIESDIDGLIINLWGNYTLTMNKNNGTFLKLNGDTTITTTANRDVGSLTLKNSSPGGTGILVNDCSLTLDHVFGLDIGDVDYGILGQGDNASLDVIGTAMNINSGYAAVSGFTKGFGIQSGEIVTPKNGKISNGALCDSKGNLSVTAEISNTAFADALTDTDEHNLLGQDLNLSTLGEWDPETETYKDYDIDLLELYNATPREDCRTFSDFNIVQGSVPPGMALVLGPSDSHPDNTAIRLRGRPTKPGLFVAGLLIAARTSWSSPAIRLVGNVRMAVNYEAPKIDYYDLWIDGFRADSEHMTDILGDGSFSYDPGTKTLTVRKNYTSDWSSVLIRSGVEGLTVKTAEDVILSSGGTVFQLEKNTRFSGNGRLTVSSEGSYGIQVKNGASLTVLDADLYVSSAGTAVAGSDGGEKLFVTDSRLYAKGKTKAVSGFSGGITLTEPGVAISSPPGGKILGGSIVKGDDSAAPEVLITSVKTYGLKIAGVTVTEANRKDVLGDGAFSFDGDRTLTLKKDYATPSSFDYVYTDIISNESVDDLVIAVENDVTLSIYSEWFGVPIRTFTNTTIRGPGRLTLVSGTSSFNPALEALGDLTLEDVCLTVSGAYWGIQGSLMYPNKLILKNSSVKATVTGSNSAVCNFPEGIELTGCVITSPASGKVSDGKIVNHDGSYAGDVTISPLVQVTGLTLNKATMNLTVGGSETLTATVTPQNASLKTVFWKSSNPAVAEVDQSGKVTGKSKGEAVITAISNGGPWSKSCTVTVSAPVSVTAVTLSKTKLSIPEGNSEYLTCTVSPSSATDKTVSWQSSNPAVATVSADGKVTAVSKGSATITVKAKDGSNKTAECKVTVTAAVHVTGVKLDKTTMTLPFNGSGTLTATVSPSNASNKLVTWKSSNPAVVAVNGAGEVTAVSDGKATITVTTADGGKSASCTVTVKPQVHVKSVKLDKTELTLVLGQYPMNQAVLSATVSPSNATFTGVTWKSSDNSVATVYKGTVTAQALGTANITVTTDDGEKTAVCKVTVIKPVYVTGITLDPDELSLGVGEKQTITPVIKPTGATNKLVTWESNKPSVASVDSYGAVTGKSEGTAVITAKTVDGAKTAVCAVTVGKVYAYYPAERSIQTYSRVTPACPLIVASYDASGRYLRSKFFTGPELKKGVILSDAKYATIMWLDLATGRPKTAAKKITLE